MSLESVKYLLQKYQIRPDTDKGQNFLVSDDILNKIVATAQLAPADRVLEIGPGIGSLTTLLAQQCVRVAAIEIDPRFKPVLDRLGAVNTNVQLEYADIRKVSFTRISELLALNNGESYKIVANIPYYLTSRLVMNVLRYPIQPASVVLLLQKEVAERIVANPGQQSKLSLSVQFYAKPELALVVSRKNFYPAPVVDSAVLKIHSIHPWSYPPSERLTWQLITFGFSSKRKKLVNNLSAGLRIPREDIIACLKQSDCNPDARAQERSVTQWLQLSECISKIAEQ